MNEQERAARNLETIRSMMQRATVYRMISGPTALFAGAVTIALALLLNWDPNLIGWKWAWFALAFVVIIFNTQLVVSKAKKENSPLFSPGLRMGLRAILPALIIGFVIGWVQPRGYSHTISAWIWMLCYGTSLMATGSFAPRSIPVLGAAFIAAGLYCFLKYPSGWYPIHIANFMMAITFGGFHLIYGLYVIFIENKRS